MTDQLATLLTETPSLSAVPRLSRRRPTPSRRCTRRPRPTGCASGRSRPGRSTGSPPWAPGPRVDPATCQVVRRWQAQRLGQLPRPAPRAPPGATRPRSSGRASRATGGRSPTGSSTGRSARAANALKTLGVQEGRPGGDLPADDPRGGHRDACLRAHRRGALRGLRRLLRGIAARPDQRRPGGLPDHRRRRLPPRLGAAAQAIRRRGDGRSARASRM